MHWRRFSECLSLKIPKRLSLQALHCVTEGPKRCYLGTCVGITSLTGSASLIFLKSWIVSYSITASNTRARAYYNKIGVTIVAAVYIYEFCVV